MNKLVLEEKLKEAKIPEYMYNLTGEGRTDERFCLEKKKTKWSVYYAERGIKTTNLSFDSEEEACQYIYNQLVL